METGGGTTPETPEQPVNRQQQMEWLRQQQRTRSLGRLTGGGTTPETQEQPVTPQQKRTRSLGQETGGGTTPETQEQPVTPQQKMEQLRKQQKQQQEQQRMERLRLQQNMKVIRQQKKTHTQQQQESGQMQRRFAIPPGSISQRDLKKVTQRSRDTQPDVEVPPQPLVNEEPPQTGTQPDTPIQHPLIKKSNRGLPDQNFVEPPPQPLVNEEPPQTGTQQPGTQQPGTQQQTGHGGGYTARVARSGDWLDHRRSQAVALPGQPQYGFAGGYSQPLYYGAPGGHLAYPQMQVPQEHSPLGGQQWWSVEIVVLLVLMSCLCALVACVFGLLGGFMFGNRLTSWTSRDKLRRQGGYVEAPQLKQRAGYGDDDDDDDGAVDPSFVDNI